MSLKELTRRTASDKILHNKASILQNIQIMMDIKEILLQWFIKVLMKNSILRADKSASGGAVKNKIISNKRFEMQLLICN